MRRRRLKAPGQTQAGFPFFKPKVQTKLKTGKPGDKYEVEADQMADQVVNKANTADVIQSMGIDEGVQQKPLASKITPLGKDLETKDAASLQKMEEEESVQTMEEEEVQTMEEEESVQAMEEEEVQAMEEEESVQAMEEEEVQTMEEEEALQSKGSTVSSVPTPVESKLRKGSGGQKMDSFTRAEMESGFGADFSQVNIHTDAEAEHMSKSLGAQAFTNGHDIYFNKGKYNPNTKQGKHLLAHELTHTIQQKGMVPAQLQLTIGDGNDLSSFRFSGNNTLEACLDGERTLRNGNRGTAVSLMQQALVDAGFELPRYGVDGIFGNETRTALRNFQNQSSLNTTGILNAETMSALDALFTNGAPALAPATPVTPEPTAPPIITSETIKAAPDGSADTRKTVGVGEYVRLTGSTAGTWTVSDGRIIGLNTGSNIVWEAPADVSSTTISLTTPGGTTVTQFSVVRPDNIRMIVFGHPPIAAGTAGAHMTLNIVFHPLSVNFGRTQLLEVPGPATNITGYFRSNFTAAQLFHNPNPNFVRMNDNNESLPLGDNAAIRSAQPPFSVGTFEWVIPNQYKVDGEPDASGRVFTHTRQSFFMAANGTLMITKAGAFVLRTINNFII